MSHRDYFASLRIIWPSDRYEVIGLKLHALDLPTAALHLSHWVWGARTFCDVNVNIENLAAIATRGRRYHPITDFEFLRMILSSEPEGKMTNEPPSTYVADVAD